MAKNCLTKLKNEDSIEKSMLPQF